MLEVWGSIYDKRRQKNGFPGLALYIKRKHWFFLKMQIARRDVCQPPCPLKCFLSQMFDISMKKKFIFGKLLLKQSWWHWPLTQWPHTIKRVPLLPRMNVWIKFEEGKSWHSQVIDRKVKGNRRTYWPTCAKQYALSSSKGGQKKQVLYRGPYCRLTFILK